MTSYYEKYLKYKNKYLELKQYGGNNDEIINDNEIINSADYEKKSDSVKNKYIPIMIKGNSYYIKNCKILFNKSFFFKKMEFIEFENCVKAINDVSANINIKDTKLEKLYKINYNKYNNYYIDAYIEENKQNEYGQINYECLNILNNKLIIDKETYNFIPNTFYINSSKLAELTKNEGLKELTYITKNSISHNRFIEIVRDNIFKEYENDTYYNYLILTNKVKDDEQLSNQEYTIAKNKNLENIDNYTNSYSNKILKLSLNNIIK
jgi:hypothetical protein